METGHSHLCLCFLPQLAGDGVSSRSVSCSIFNAKIQPLSTADSAGYQRRMSCAEHKPISEYSSLESSALATVTTDAFSNYGEVW